LTSADFASPFAVFHQRYSTNTQPTWHLAQPFRFVAHNGEINTLSANRRWMRARQAALRRSLGVGDWFRALEEGVSDSASFDNAFEILLQQGSSLPAAMLRMVPPAWESDGRLPPELRAYFEAQAREQEPWDGPAALVFSDGRMVGAKLDRNGLRPLRYTRTSDGLLVVGSEVGLADLSGKQIAERQRLGPGEMLLVDPVAGTIFRGSQLSRFLTPTSERTTFVPALRLAPKAVASTGPAQQLKQNAKRWAGPKISFGCSFNPWASRARKLSGAWATTRRRRFFLRRAGRSGTTASSALPR
jgi:glutamine phosphoribosylpyrophosphate amidotransferase